MRVSYKVPTPTEYIKAVNKVGIKRGDKAILQHAEIMQADMLTKRRRIRQAEKRGK